MNNIRIGFFILALLLYFNVANSQVDPLIIEPIDSILITSNVIKFCEKIGDSEIIKMLSTNIYNAFIL